MQENVEVAILPTAQPALSAPETQAEASSPEPAEAPVSTAADEDQPATKWPLPQMLLGQLRQVTDDDPNAAWATAAAERIRQICQSDFASGHNAAGELRALIEGKTAVAPAAPASESRFARTRYALARWLDIWEAATALDTSSPIGEAARGNPERIRACLAGIESFTRKGSNGAAWRRYLQLDNLRRAADTSRRPDEQANIEIERRAIARLVLDRLASSRLSQAQQKFAAEGPLTTLKTELRAWAAEPVTASRLLAHLEQYEQTGLASDARALADDLRGLNWSSGAAAEQVSQHLDTHYCNANIRIAAAGPLLNRMLPQPQPVEASVRDTVMNVPTYGRSTTFTKLSVRLVPDPHRIRLGLEASGLVASDTVSASGPAKFYNEGQSSFLVRKLLVLGPHGLTVWPAIAEAENNFTYLVSLETDFDDRPLVGSLVRNIARSQHEEARDGARIEVEQKVAMRARDQLDAEVRPRLVKAAEKFQSKQLATLDRLGLELAPVSLSTTEERVVARYRVASAQQLGAHTPRPRAPSDSWFSLQLHQSALNNVLEKMDLNGRVFALPELFAWIAKKLDRPQMATVDDLPEDVHMKFAAQDAVRLRCQADRIEVTFALTELTQAGKRWRNFTVRTFYRPESKELSPCFVRDSMIYLEGKSHKGKAEPVLRAIFSKVLSRSRDIRLLDEEVTSDPRFQDLEITQFGIDDGWIALAYSPRRTPNNLARRPK